MIRRVRGVVLRGNFIGRGWHVGLGLAVQDQTAQSTWWWWGGGGGGWYLSYEFSMYEYIILILTSDSASLYMYHVWNYYFTKIHNKFKNYSY